MKIFNKLTALFLIVLIITSGCSQKNNIETSKIPDVTEEQTTSAESDENIISEIKPNEINQAGKIDKKVGTVETKEIEKDNGDNITQTEKETINVENNKTDYIENAENKRNDELDNTISLEDKQKKEEVKPTEENANDEKQTDDNSFSIEGKVKNELKLTVNDLKSMDDIFFEADFFSLNSFGTKAYFHFKGVNLWNLLEQKAEIFDDATSVTIIAEDGYKMAFTVEQVKKQDYIDEQNKDVLYPMIIAWEENEVEYDAADGAPFKLVVGQKEAGDVNKPQWVSNIDKIVIE